MPTQTTQPAEEAPAAENPSGREIPLHWAFPALIFALYTAVYLMKVPDPVKMLWDPDWGYQLAGATQIRHGLWPFLDFHALYGPLAFAASALAQWLAGGRVIGEFALSYCGYLASFLLLYGLAAKLSGSRKIAFAVTLFALLVFPKLYKYYIVLTPLWVMWESWRYLEKPSIGRFFLLCLAIVVTGLFRPDTGLYAAVAGLATVWLAHREERVFWRQAALFIALLLACASPWLIALIARHRLHDYFYQSIHDGAGLARGLSLPWPRINFTHNTFATETFVATLYNFFFTLVPFCAVALYASRKTIAQDQQKRLIAAMILSQLCLLESIHRPDYHHLNQALVPSLVLVGWVLTQLPQWLKAPSRGWRITGLASCAALAFLLVASVVVEHRIGYREHRLQPLAKTLSVYMLRPPDVVEYVLKEDPHNPYAIAALFLRGARRDERVFVMPYYDSLYYFSNRAFGQYMEILPGLHSDPQDQRAIIADLQREHINIVVVDPTFEIDNKEDRRIDRFAGILLPYVMKHYHEIRRAGHYGPLSIRIGPGYPMFGDSGFLFGPEYWDWGRWPH